MEAFGVYSTESVEEWAGIVKKQEIRDRVFFPWLSQFFRPGTVLDLGAACGQTSQYLRELGFRVTSSDIIPEFVTYMAERGLDAHVIDATNIQDATAETFDNVFAQGLSPQMCRLEPDVTRRAYISIARALKPHGRFVSISGLYNYRHRYKRARYFSRAEHLAMIQSLDLFKIVRVVPHMVVPPRIYRGWNSRVLNFMDFKLAKLLPNRVVIVLEKI